MNAKARYDQMAQSIRKAATRYQNRHVKLFSHDAKMVKLIKQDTKDLRDIAYHVHRGSLQSAFFLMENLDTLVRDEIPARAYNYCFDVAEKNRQRGAPWRRR